MKGLSKTSKSTQESHLYIVDQWTTDWRIKINIDKSTTIHFTKRYGNLPTAPELQNQAIPIEPIAKYLGVYLDRRLTFKHHITTIANKANQRLFALYAMFKSPVLSIKTKLHIYKMMIRSLLLYAAPVWKNAAKSHIIKLQRVQNKAARIITGHSRDTTIIQLLDDLDLPYLDSLIDQIHINFWRKIQHSNQDHITNIGTLIAQRQLYKMPKPP